MNKKTSGGYVSRLAPITAFLDYKYNVVYSTNALHIINIIESESNEISVLL